MRQSIIPASINATSAFAPGMQAGDYLFISGQVSQDSEGNIIGTGDCEAQTRQVMRRIKAIAEAAGATMQDVIKTTTFLTDVTNYPGFNKVRAETFPKDPPASSTVIVAALVRQEFLIEIEAIVYNPIANNSRTYAVGSGPLVE